MTHRTGIGIDVEEVERFRALHPTHPARFLERVYTMAERAYCFGRPDPAPHLAARFCAKEAVIKALSQAGFPLCAYADIELISSTGVAPRVRLPNGYAADVRVSWSHTPRTAMACAWVAGA